MVARSMAIAAVLLASTTVSAFMAPMTLRSTRQAGPVAALSSRAVRGVYAAPSRRRLSMQQAAATMTLERKSKVPANVRDMMYAPMGKLATVLEEVLHAKMELMPFELPENMGYVEATYEGDQCAIQNSVWRTKSFRKIHIELATFFNKKGEGTGLDVLHCVVFPDPEAVGHTVPMFGCDLVCVKSKITAAIVDLSPVSSDKKLPADYLEAFERRAGKFTKFTSPRDLPEFGKLIFSDQCQFVRPVDDAEEAMFVDLCREVLSLHCELADTRLGIKHEKRSVQEAVDGQTYYCEQQSKNDKTRRILNQSFGVEWTDMYMAQVLFDVPTPVPTESVA